jgi:hypothetical protein
MYSIAKNLLALESPEEFLESLELGIEEGVYESFDSRIKKAFKDLIELQL